MAWCARWRNSPPSRERAAPSAEVPVAHGATLEDALTSGEEVELVCVGPEDKVRDAGLHAFGVMTKDKSVRVVDADGVEMALAARGYDHFA